MHFRGSYSLKKNAHIWVLSAGLPTAWTHYNVTGCEISEKMQAYVQALLDSYVK